MSTTMTETVTATETFPPYTVSGEIIKDAEHYRELKERNPLNTDYSLLKRVTAEQGLLSSAGFVAVGRAPQKVEYICAEGVPGRAGAAALDGAQQLESCACFC